MRYKVTGLTLTAPQSAALPWDADSIVASNMTQYTLLVRVGNNAPPATFADADYIVPPLGQQVIPAAGRLFGFRLTATPSLNNPAPGVPPVCSVVISAGERSPAFSSVNFASIYLATEQVVLRTQATRAAGGYIDAGIAVASNIRSIAVQNQGGNLTFFTITGDQSGLLYFSNIPANMQTPVVQSGNYARFPFFPALDSTITVQTVSTGGSNGYQLTGDANAYAPEVNLKDARQWVYTNPPGKSYTPSGPPDPVRAGRIPVASYSAAQAVAQIDTTGYTKCRITAIASSGPGNASFQVFNVEAFPLSGLISSVFTTSTVAWGTGRGVGIDIADHDVTAAVSDIFIVAGSLPQSITVQMGATLAGSWTGGLEVWLS